MASKTFSFKALLFFFSRILHRRLRNPRSLHRKLSNTHLSQFKLQRFPSLAHKSELSNLTMVFQVEKSLLKSSSLFSYFMLVAFEAGGTLRALLLCLLYPFVCLVNEEMGMMMMVMVCFCGIKKDSFRVGRAVLPKFFLEDVGFEGFEVLMRGGRKVGVSDLPRVMVEGFLRDYLEVEFVVGRELKVINGYYVGLMEEKKKGCLPVEEMLREDKRMGFDAVGIGSFKKAFDHPLFSHCKEVYLVNESERRSWQHLPKQNYPKPLIFHDGRLALRPTPLSTLALFMWVPFGLFLAFIRALIGLLLPYKIGTPILAFTGLKLRLILTKPNSPISFPSSKTHKNKPKGLLYVCNHRTLLDPLYLSGILQKPITAVTYSLSRVSELLAPMKTVRLTRDRDQDAKMIEKLLKQDDLVVCPEGTTCREPYLLRFSPLFAEMADEIVPVAMDVHVSMFYGTTASGLKCLDPLFFLMNPFPRYKVKLLENVSGSSTCLDGDHKSRFDVANHVQKEIGNALRFQCTRLTRKDKYMMLAGNEGFVNVGKKL